MVWGFPAILCGKQKALTTATRLLSFGTWLGRVKLQLIAIHRQLIHHHAIDVDDFVIDRCRFARRIKGDHAKRLFRVVGKNRLFHGVMHMLVG